MAHQSSEFLGSLLLQKYEFWMSIVHLLSFPITFQKELIIMGQSMNMN